MTVGTCFDNGGNLFDRLPNEIVLSIFDRMDPKALFTTANRVCSRWYVLIESKLLIYFERLLRCEFGDKKLDALLQETNANILPELLRFLQEHTAFTQQGAILSDPPTIPCCGGFLAAFNSTAPYFTKHGRHQYWLNMQTFLPEPFSLLTKVLNFPFEFEEAPGIMFCLHNGTLRFEQLAKHQMTGQRIQVEYDASVRFIAVIRFCTDYNSSCDGRGGYIPVDSFDDTLSYRFVLPSCLSEKTAHRLRYYSPSV